MNCVDIFSSNKFNFLFMKEGDEFSQRLKQAMRDAGYPIRPVVLEREFNTRYWGRSITVQAVRRWLNGEAIPSQDKLQVLADWLKVEPHVLRFGEHLSISIQERKKRWDAAISDPEREVLEAFISLPSDRKKTVRDVILTYSAFCKMRNITGN
jgi:transcriptional regulator with XRE-family HTH domain